MPAGVAKTDPKTSLSKRTIQRKKIITRPVTPETELRIHLSKAREYWYEDRLDLAMAAVKNALRVGVPAGNWYDFQRTVEAEWGVRRDGRITRISEELSVEGDGIWERRTREFEQIALRALHDVTDTLAVLWGKPVLVTIFPRDEWVEFMRARYGYYAQRAEWHKVCLPPAVSCEPGIFLRAARHELTHAAIHELAGEGVPRWLDEGVAVLMEGPVDSAETAFLTRHVSANGAPALNAISSGFESFGVSIGSMESRVCYAAAADFVNRALLKNGMIAIRAVLESIGKGRAADRAFREVFAISLPTAEREWQRSFVSRLAS